VVYVDSCSQDNSVQQARELTPHVLVLDNPELLSAARARNEGAQYVFKELPDTKYLQFIDGDTVIDSEWLKHGIALLEQRPGVGATFGSLRELNPDFSIYNRMCDAEWDPASEGEASHCGGNMLVSREVFEAIGGYRSHIIDSEDIDLGERIRAAGHSIWFLIVPMGKHDVAISKFSQWWRRAVRNGHGLAQLADTHGRAGDRSRIIAVVKTLIWGLALPAAALVSLFWWPRISLLFLVPYLALALRMFSRSARKPFDLVYALFTALVKIPLSYGILKYGWRKVRRVDPKLIEYK
jgi:GT2 family glycosyltransferase